MTSLKDTPNNFYGQKLRVRACGILITDNRILLAGHLGLTESGEFWMPPGGGVEFGESLEEALQREFLEETGLAIKTDKLLAVHEFIELPLHAIEFFFAVKSATGKLITGSDPEMATQTQLLTEVRFFSLEALKMMPAATLHPVLQNIESFEQLLSSPFRLSSDVKAK